MASQETHHKGGTALYWKIGAVLTVITALEVAVFYVEALQGVLATLLILMGAAKFVLVAMYFMHLKFDSRVFTGFFLAGIIMTIATVLAVVAMMTETSQAAGIV